jgi:glycosyltransferase involved in cell wall biosynthesis
MGEGPMKKTLSFTVGIPTYNSTQSLVETVKSIRASKDVDDFRLIVSVDGPTMSKEIENALKPYNVDIVQNKIREGQTARNKQIGKLTNTDVLVMTQEDVIFDKHTLSIIVKAFSHNPKLTMASARLYSLVPETLIEKILGIGTNLTKEISSGWNGGDNYLLAIGRCLAYRTKMYKSFEIPNQVVNCDAYYYVENKRLKGIYKNIPSATLFYRNPQSMKEHLKQVGRFVYSQNELTKYFGEQVLDEYKIPSAALFKALLIEFFRNPVLFILYSAVKMYTGIKTMNSYSDVSLYWDTDKSTKKILSEAQK